jgi:glycosyltransferase involved in cell wall biosynthesis
MRILMIAPEPFFSPRGTPISIYHRLRAFSRLGIHVDLVTYHLGQDLDIDGVRIFRMPRLPLVRRIKVGPSYIKPLLDLVLFFKAMSMLATGRYDAIHAHEEAAYFSLPLASLFGLRLLYDMHSSLPQQLKNYGFSRIPWLSVLFVRMERSVLRRADTVITICPDLQRHVDLLGGEAKDFLIENTSVEPSPEGIDRLTRELRRRFDLTGRPLVVYTGTFEKNQGLEMLIHGADQVLSEFPRAAYLFVGGRPDQIARLRRLARQHGGDDHFVFPGTRPLEEIPVYLAAADVLVSPRSQGTNTPLKIYSYLAAGKPVVATDLETHRQVLDDRVARLVPPTAQGLADGIGEMLRDPSRARDLARAAGQLVGEKYSYRSYLDKTRQALDHLQGR